MHIAMIGTKGVPAKWGGIEKYIEEVGQRLVERGHEVTVFGSRWFLREYRQDSYKGIRIRRVPAIPLQATDAMSNAFFAAAMVAPGKYDIVNLHGYASYYTIPIIRKAGKITVVTAHGVDSGWDNPKYSGFARGTLRKAFKFGLHSADCVVTVADHLKQKIKEVYAVDAHVLPSGLDVAQPQPSKIIKNKYGLNGGDYLLFLGRIDPIKRVDWLLDVATALGNGFRLVIAGGAQNSATQSYLEDLKHLAGLDSRILFTGPVFGNEKSELLSNCLIFLAPSRDEGLPITLLEAIAHGRCCVASDIPANREVIEDGATGYLVPRDDKCGFVQKVRDLATKPRDEIDLIGAGARKAVVSRFNWETTVQKTEMLFEGLLNEINAYPKSR